MPPPDTLPPAEATTESVKKGACTEITAVAGAEGESALDLYAGVGLFALALAKRFHSVIAVESGSGAVRDLKFNAERAGAAQDDPARLLEGAGKRMRHVKLRSAQQVNAAALSELIAAAYRDIRLRLGSEGA